jgi:hypothetical protein
MATPTFELVSRPEKPMSPSGGQITKFDNPDNSFTFFGYVGFRHMSDFKTFVTDVEFVRAYINYRRIMKLVRGGPKSHLKALAWLYFYTQADGSRIIMDVDDEQDSDDHPIPSSLGAVFRKYGAEEGRKTELIGCLLYIVDETFQRAVSKYETGTNDGWKTATIARMYKDLKDNHWFKIPTKYQTKVGLREDHPLPPGLRSESTEQYQEHICERWNRIWHCFRMMDHYRSSPKKNILFNVSQDRAILSLDPQWWMSSKTRPRDPRPQHIILREGLSRFHGRSVACELVLVSGQESLQRHLELSPYKWAAERLQEPQTINRPGFFRSLQEWLTSVDTGLCFRQLEVSFKEVRMLLRGRDGLTCFEEQVIFSDDTEWSLDQIETACDEVSAVTAVFTCVLNPRVPPSGRPLFVPARLASQVKSGLFDGLWSPEPVDDNAEEEFKGDAEMVLDADDEEDPEEGGEEYTEMVLDADDEEEDADEEGEEDAVMEDEEDAEMEEDAEDEERKAKREACLAYFGDAVDDEQGLYSEEEQEEEQEDGEDSDEIELGSEYDTDFWLLQEEENDYSNSDSDPEDSESGEE